MAWIYLAESEESQKPWKIGSNQSPTVKTIDIAGPSSCQGCEVAISHAYLSGTMLQLSIHRFLSHSQILSTGGSHAKISPQLIHLEKVWEESEVDYFSKSKDWFAKYDRDSSSWKMSPPFVQGEGTLLERDWPMQGMIVDGLLYPRRKSGHITKGKDGFFWPTPDASQRGARINQKGHHFTLQDAVRRIYGPGPLNPRFVEWLMGYLSGWTVLEDWATLWFRPKQKKRLKF